MSTDLPSRREALYRALSEAALLPPEDPRRREVEATVSRSGGGVAETWLALLEEGERWRLALGRVDPPGALEARLLDLPQREGLLSGLATTVRRRSWSAVAVVALAIVGTGLYAFGHRIFRPQEPASAEEAIQNVARLARDDHLSTHESEVHATDPVSLAQKLEPLIPFVIRLPDLGEGITPQGGRRCTLGSHPVVFTSWRGQGGRLTLLQLRAVDFNLPETFRPRLVQPSGEMPALDVLLFGERGMTWVVVADSSKDLQRVLESRERN